MRAPIFVRTLTSEERQTLESCLRSSDAFVLRRCQILLASSRGQRAPAIARYLGCSLQTPVNVIKAFNEKGLEVLVQGSNAPLTRHAAFEAEQMEGLRELLHQSPRAFGKPTGLWTLALAADVSFETGLTPERVSGETIRATLSRMGVKWKRAKHWITSPDPAYARKKSSVTDSSVS